MVTPLSTHPEVSACRAGDVKDIVMYFCPCGSHLSSLYLSLSYSNSLIFSCSCKAPNHGVKRNICALTARLMLPAQKPKFNSLSVRRCERFRLERGIERKHATVCCDFSLPKRDEAPIVAKNHQHDFASQSESQSISSNVCDHFTVTLAQPVIQEMVTAKQRAAILTASDDENMFLDNIQGESRTVEVTESHHCQPPFQNHLENAVRRSKFTLHQHKGKKGKPTHNSEQKQAVVVFL